MQLDVPNDSLCQPRVSALCTVLRALAELPKGHVATVIGISKDGTQVFCLGGNQNGGLNISAYPISLFKGAEVVYRKPAGQNNHTPAPTFDYHADEDMFSLLSGLTR